MKMSKNIVLLSITIVTLIALVAIATYSYFTAATSLTNKIATNVKMPLRPTFAVSGGGEIALTVTRNLTLKENAYTGTWVSDKNYKFISKNLMITLTGEPGTTCTYNVYYKDTSSNSTIIQIGDFDVQFYKNGIHIFNIDINNFRQTNAGISKITAIFGGSTFPFNQAKQVITVPAGNTSITDIWEYGLLFVNQNRDQTYLAGKTFKGELYIDDVSCT